MLTPAVSVTVGTFAADCTTAQTVFHPNDTICAHVTGATPGWQLIWSNADFVAVQRNDITAATQDITFTLSANPSRGDWRVIVYDPFGDIVQASSSFTVSDPANPLVDLQVAKTARSSQASPGVDVSFAIQVTNGGPDTATNVQLTDSVPANTTFVSFFQFSGPSFACTNPTAGGTGDTVCTIASLNKGDTAIFLSTYSVVGTASVGDTISNTASVSNSVADSNSGNDTSTASVIVQSAGGNGGGTTCSVACPDDIVTPANTHQDPNDPNSPAGAIVHFSPPSGNTECGVIVVDHCDDCFFPVGVTVVTATGVGGSCSFNVTVTPAGSAPTVSCPANQSGNADNNCQANINVGTATATGNNVTVVGYRSDGQPLYDCDPFGNCTRRSSDAPFNAGVTTITWYAYSHDVAGPYSEATGDEESHRTGSATCTQTVTVNDVTPPTIGATNSSASADANCQAPVPDYSSTVSDNCACASSDTSDSCAGHARITVTQDPAAGTMVGLGPHTVHITANDGSSNNDGAGNTSTKDVTFTVNDTTEPTITCPANVTTNTAPGTCSAAVVTGPATATDNCDSNPTITATRSDGQPLIALYPKGTTTITWTATDASGNHSSCTQTVTVVDNELPTITFNGNTPSMSPPNHSYHTFTPADFISSVSDNCDPLTINDVYITQATSDEPNHSGGSGNTTPDIVIATNCKSVQLRAERVGGGNGRVYTIYFKLKDSSGNFTTGTAKVIVPVDTGGTAVDDGPNFTVTSGCP